MQQAACVRRKRKPKKKDTKKSAAPEIHHDIHSSPATATTSRRRSTRHIPRVSPYTPASIDPGLVEIGLVQLSQLPMAKTASVASFLRPVFFTANGPERETTHDRHKQSSQRPPQCIPLLQSCEVALERVSNPLGARGNILPASVGSAQTWSERVSTISKTMQTSPCPAAFRRKPQRHHQAHGSHSTS